MKKSQMAMALLKAYLILQVALSIWALNELLELMMMKELPRVQNKPWDEWMKRHEDLWTQ